MSILDYRTLEELLLDYSTHSSPGDVILRDAHGDHQPAQLLHQLSQQELRAPIVELGGDGGEQYIVARSSSWARTVERRFTIHWSPERQGWAFPNGFGRTTHYFVPKHYLDDPPYCSDGVLVSLCKRMFLSSDHLFRPPDPKYAICKSCERTYDQLLHERGGYEQA